MQYILNSEGKWDLWVLGQSGLYIESQVSWGYIVRPSLKKKKKVYKDVSREISNSQAIIRTSMCARVHARALLMRAWACIWVLALTCFEVESFLLLQASCLLSFQDPTPHPTPASHLWRDYRAIPLHSAFHGTQGFKLRLSDTLSTFSPWTVSLALPYQFSNRL